MNMFDKLSERELNMITDRRAQHCMPTDSCRFAGNEHILRYWSKAKEKLCKKLFGGELIIEKEFSVEKKVNDISDDIAKKLGEYSDGRKWANFYDKWYKICASIEKLNGWSARCGVGSLLNSDTLARNSYLGANFKIDIGTDKPFSLLSGCKPVKAIKGLFEAFGYENDVDLEAFRIAHSQCLNDKVFKGTLCLSIHPLDFMTMSDNSYHWSSCMSWDNSGCYRMGTVEMMNSPYVVVGYLKGEEDYKINDESWNSKKWRQLFVVDDSMILAVKGYPYWNEGLQETMVSWIRDLHWNSGEFDTQGYFNPCETWHPEDAEDSDEYGDWAQFTHKCRINPETEFMYNDFQDVHYGAFIDKDMDDYNEINYSGVAECMGCGDAIDYDNWDSDDCDDAGFLLCNNCEGAVYCDHCGHRIFSGDDRYYIDDEMWCAGCYDDNALDDFIDGELHNIDDMKRIFLIDPEKKVCYYDGDNFMTLEDNIDSVIEKNSLYVANFNTKFPGVTKLYEFRLQYAVFDWDTMKASETEFVYDGETRYGVDIRELDNDFFHDNYWASKEDYMKGGSSDDGRIHINNVFDI